MPRALIVDDIDDNLYFLRVLLTANGYEVEAAHNGSEALALAHKVKPDLIITDLLMPVMDGFTLCQTCRTTPEFAEIPIIVYTATYTDPEDEDLALNQGADLFLIKPMEPELLINTVNDLMRRYAAGLQSRRPLLDWEEGLSRQYNSVLVRKLEDKLEELGTSQRRLNAIIEGMSQGLITVSSVGAISAVNKRVEEMFGYDRSELIGQQLQLLVPESLPDFLDQYRRQYQSPLSVESAGLGMNLAGRRKDGSGFPIEVGLSYVGDGDGIETIGLISDITERKRLEEQLRQAQRLEAISRLTGGIAHDFNNLLTVIIGQSAALLEESQPEAVLRGGLESINHAADRAAMLTRQLLAFSRRQVLQPKIMNLNTEVENLDRMLRRVIGEDIRISTSMAPDLWMIKADPGQVGQVIMNLTLNARDAMPEGGVLTLETKNAELDETSAQGIGGANPGSYVVLAVSDTGSGMEQETMARIFDPFFTTKEHGNGTGLGLSTVHGIVMQSGGHICVESEKGRGSTFRIYLPRATDAPQLPPAPVTDPVSLRGCETILLVEDEPMVRKTIHAILKRQGYSVLTAEDFTEARSACINHQGNIHLLLTDMVIPGGTGRTLSELVQQMRPGTRILYMSGYTASSVLPQGVLGARVNFLQKPFAPSQLARKVRDVLDLSSF